MYIHVYMRVTVIVQSNSLSNVMQILLRPKKFHVKVTLFTNIHLKLIPTCILSTLEIERFTIQIGFYTFQQRRIANNSSLWLGTYDGAQLLLAIESRQFITY